jgi:ribosomal protein L15E
MAARFGNSGKLLNALINIADAVRIEIKTESKLKPLMGRNRKVQRRAMLNQFTYLRGLVTILTSRVERKYVQLPIQNSHSLPTGE